MTTTTLYHALDKYLDAVTRLGSPVRKVIRPLADSTSLDALRALDAVTLPDELVAYFSHINGYDDAALAEQNLFEPTLAWAMYALSVDDILREHDQLQFAIDEDDTDYWVNGFLPILSDGAGSVVAVNCIAGSPTFGGVYELTDCVGLNRIASSLSKFFEGSTAAIMQKFISYNNGMLLPEHPRFFELAGVFYGDSPYFARVGNMDTQIIDWR